MMKKAKTYLASIQTATTERELTGIEIKFKQDVSIDWDDISKLCRAADDRRYILRNKVDTIQLKEILFKRTGAEMDAYHDMSRKPESWSAEEMQVWRSRIKRQQSSRISPRKHRPIRKKNLTAITG